MKDKSNKDIIQLVSDGGRPESTEKIEIIEEYEKIMKEAWSQEPDKRPEADEVYEKLLKLSNERGLTSPTIHPSTKSPCENSASELPCLGEGVPDIEEIKQLHRAGRYEEAFAKFTKLAESGNAEAFHYIGLCYGKGLCVEANEATAIDDYGEAADRGHVELVYKYSELGLHRLYKYVEKAVKYYALLPSFVKRQIIDNGLFRSYSGLFRSDSGSLRNSLRPNIPFSGSVLGKDLSIDEKQARLELFLREYVLEVDYVFEDEKAVKGVGEKDTNV